jgi:UPF0755 protein
MKNHRRRSFLVLSTFLVVILAVGLMAGFFSINAVVRKQFGRPTQTLTFIQRVIYPIELFVHRDTLASPRNVEEDQQIFVIESGESVSMICLRLERAGLVHDAELLRTYLVYTGLDRQLQSGQFSLNQGMSPVQITAELLDATPSEVIVTILPGWRIEEVAANVAESGLAISPEAFINSAYNPEDEFLNLVPVSDVPSLEGFLFPGIYVFQREAVLAEVLEAMLSEFSNQLDPALEEGFSRVGLSLYEAVTLASIIEKEAVVDAEKPMIASVFFNRLAAGMRLETDPTVQYSLGFQEETGTWWKAPLSLDDLKVASPYNTYIVYGLPPTPINNPDLVSLRAVAFPAETPYFYFRAACDGSGRHLFAITFDDHLNNACD